MEVHRGEVFYADLSPVVGSEQGLSLIHTDAADDLLCVDLGGRRIIKKKKREDRLR